MEWLVLAVMVLIVLGVGLFWTQTRRRRSAAALADARADAQRWYDRLGGQVMNLPAGEQPAVRQAMIDAGERYNAAGAQLDSARTARQYELARETALEGLAYIRAARLAQGLDPGPDLPPLAGQQAAGTLKSERAVDVQGHRYTAGPNPSQETPYYYPGGTVSGRPVAQGWYSEPWWKTALVAGAWGLGAALVFDALFNPAWAGYGDGVAADGFVDGGQGFEAGGDAGSDTAGDYGGDVGGSDFGGSDFGGGDFGGGGGDI
jgi:uncharacterized membrane protein YgcG